MKGRTCLAATSALALLAACSGSDEPELHAGSLRALHAIPQLDLLTFTLDGEELTRFNYGGIGGINGLVAGPHDVRIDIDLPEGDDTPSRLATLDLTTEPDVEQTFVLAGTLEDHDLIEWVQPARDWDTELAENENLDILEVSFGHAGARQGAFDFYIGEEGFDPAAVAPMATLSYTEMREAVDLEAGLYQVVLTPAGDPATELIRSNEFTMPIATSVMFVAYDSADVDDDGNPLVALRSIGEGLSGVIPDPDLPARMRVINAATGVATFDVLLEGAEDEDDTVLIPDLDYGTVSSYVSLEPGNAAFEIVETEPDVIVSTTVVAGSEGTLLVAGPDDAAGASFFVDDNRSIITHAKFRALNGASNFDALDIYLVPPGTSIEDEPADVRTLVFRGATVYLAAATGDFDIVVTEFGSKTVAAGPVPVTFAKGGVYGIAIVDGEAENSLEVIPMDDLADAP
jgi:hypothetical protein